MKGLSLAALAIGVYFFFKGRGGNGTEPPPTGEVVYLHASDGYGLVGPHGIVDKIAGTTVANVGYDPNVFGLVAGKTYQYTSTGNYLAQLTTSWAGWPAKPVNTRAVTLTITSGSTSGNIAGVGFEFRLT